MSKVYKDKKKGIHVCFKGSHYVAPANTKVDITKQVDIAFDTVIPGFVTVTQDSLLEAWQSIGAYVALKPAKVPKAAKPEKKVKIPSNVKKNLEMREPVKELPVPGPAAMDLVEARIDAVSPCQDAKDIMMVCFKNWIGGDRRLPLFQGLNYRDPEVTKKVHALGQELIAEWT